MISRALRDRIPEPIKKIARRLFGAPAKDYRGHLFDETRARLAGMRPARILEIGPKDGKDTARLLTLDPTQLLMIELDDKTANVDVWYPGLARPGVELRYGNFMYEAWVDELEPFDLVWCTGVLYHNPEQLRMVARLFDLTKPGGLLVLESATARRRFLREENCIELWYPPPAGAIKKKYHVSANVSHVPSRKALESWLAMTGFRDIRPSACHRKQSRALARDRAAFLATRGDRPGVYYSLKGHDFVVGKAR
jgi:SAM-dependent methyltransferase